LIWRTGLFLLNDIGQPVLGALDVVGDAHVAGLAFGLEFACQRQLRFEIAEVVDLQQLDLVRPQALEGGIELRKAVFAAAYAR
jgi:hypothetical protein